MIRTASAKQTGPMNKGEAKALTDRIRSAVDGLWQLLLEAHDRQAFKALGYATWEAYVKDEFGMGRSRAYQILDQGRAIEAIREATGDLSTMVDISERDARDIKPALDEVKADVAARVEAGQQPAEAVQEAVAAGRTKAKEERAAKKVEHERKAEETKAQFSPEVQAKAAKPEPLDADALLAEVEELREANAALQADVARLTAEINKFAEMKAEFDRGGFEEVIAGKDEVIATLKTRVERESQEKVSNLRSADMWRKRAEEAGWSNDIEIDIPGRALHA